MKQGLIIVSSLLCIDGENVSRRCRIRLIMKNLRSDILVVGGAEPAFNLRNLRFIPNVASRNSPNAADFILISEATSYIQQQLPTQVIVGTKDKAIIEAFRYLSIRYNFKLLKLGDLIDLGGGCYLNQLIEEIDTHVNGIVNYSKLFEFYRIGRTAQQVRNAFNLSETCVASLHKLLSTENLIQSKGRSKGSKVWFPTLKFSELSRD